MLVLPDVSFRGKIDEEDLKDDTCAKEEDSRREHSEFVVDRVVHIEKSPYISGHLAFYFKLNSK